VLQLRREPCPDLASGLLLCRQAPLGKANGIRGRASFPGVAEGEEVVDLGVSDNYDIEEDSFVEAIVTIANDSVLLRAIKNPNTMGDRAFISYQHDTVPNRFWGRGVAEKGFNMQKALDSELRGRIDAMALTIHPMMGVDATRMPRGMDLTVRPGKSILTQGDPSQVLRPMNFGQVSPSTFSQSGELERMLQMGTGSMDSAAPVGVSPRNNTASGMSMMLSGAIKRSKRTLSNIERHFTSPLVHKAAWRYMDFAPLKYPVTDVKFVVNSTLGIMAREVEQQQLTSLLQTVQAGTPEFYMLLKSIYENSSIADREQMIKLTEQKLQQALNPQPPQPTPADQIAMQKLQVDAMEKQGRVQNERIRAQADMMRAAAEASKADSAEVKAITESILNLAKAEAEEVGSNMARYTAIVDAIAQSTGEKNESGNTEAVRGNVGSVPAPRMEAADGGVSNPGGSPQGGGMAGL